MKSKIFAMLLLFVTSFFCGCTKTLGWSVVLWGDEENGLKDGEIVKVYVRSNITHSYIIEHPDGRGRAEIKIWQISEPEKKSKAEKTAQKYEEYTNTFASVKADGLPIRAEAANTAKQVYRLREKEIIRILYIGEGATVTNSKGAMQGDWYRVLTNDGTQGWCFSYNLDIYNSNEGGKRQEEIAEQTKDDLSAFKKIVETRWYPQEFAELLKAKRIDPLRIKSNFGCFIDSNSGKISILTADDSLSWNFKGAKSKSGGKFLLEGADVTLFPRGEDELTVTYKEDGRPKNAHFVSLSANIDDLLSKEKKRRASEFAKIVNLSSRYESSNYGTLLFSPSGTFGWKNFSLLVPSVISENAKENGRVQIEYFLSDSLKSSYDGILTFRFSGQEKEVNFLYKLTSSGLRLEDASKANIKNNVVSSRGTSPLILFFEAKN